METLKIETETGMMREIDKTIIKEEIKHNNKIIAPTLLIKRICFFIFFLKYKNLLMLYPDSTNGIANPREYELKSKTPWLTVFSIAAKVKIDPKIGPMHGLQPNAKATPIIKGKK